MILQKGTTLYHLLDKYSPMEMYSKSTDICTIVRCLFLSMLSTTFLSFLGAAIIWAAIDPYVMIVEYFLYEDMLWDSVLDTPWTAFGVLIHLFVVWLIVEALYGWIDLKNDIILGMTSGVLHETKKPKKKKEPGLIKTWYKSFKEKTCIIVDINHE